MKKFLLLFGALSALALGASAQKAQIHVGYGGYTQMDNCDMHDGGKVDNAWGALTAGVNFEINRTFSLGATYTFSSAAYKHVDDAHVYYHVVMLNGKYNYFRAPGGLRLYAHAAVGCDISHMAWDGDSKDKGYFAFQISPLGAEYQLTPSAALFGEIGYGAQGLLQVGFRFGI